MQHLNAAGAKVLGTILFGTKNTISASLLSYGLPVDENSALKIDFAHRV